MPHTTNTYERNRLLNRLLLVTIAATTLHTIWDTITVSWIIGLGDFIIVVVLAAFLYLNYSKHYLIARYGTLLFTTLVVLVYSSLVPRDIGVSLLFFPIISLAFVIFDYQQKSGRWFIASLVVIGYLVLEFFDYKLLGKDVWLMQEQDRVSYVVNFLTAAVLIYFSFSFLTKAHFKAEQNLRSMSAEIEKQNAELSKANHELDRFVYSTSHDLRAPLRSVMGLLNILDQQPKEEERQQYLGMIRGRIENLDKFITDITLYSRNMRLEVKNTEVNLRELAEEVIENHRYIDIAEPISFFLKINPSLTLLTDSQRLTTVLSNLVSNAIKYHNTYQANPWIKVTANKSATEFSIMVSDNGPGMPADVRDKIFTMFYRGDERSEGSGLGLYIVQEVVEKLNGKIGVESEPGKGSTFTVTVPLA